jgi:hypothetical protein
MQLLFWLSSKRLLILSHSIVFGALRCHCSYDIHTISISDMIQLSHQPGGWIYVDLRELLKLTTLSWCSSLAEKVLSRKALFNFSQISQIQTFSKASRKIYTCCEICWISFDTKLLNILWIFCTKIDTTVVATHQCNSFGAGEETMILIVSMPVSYWPLWCNLILLKSSLCCP